MIHIFHGEDDFSKKEALDVLRRQVGPEEVWEANTTRLPGAGLSLNDLVRACSAVPFLAERRLVVVEGLLKSLEENRAARRPGRGRAQGDGMGEWSGAAQALGQLPSTTLLVFLEGKLEGSNALLKGLAPDSQVREFRNLVGQALEAWIYQRVTGLGTRITRQAVRRMIDLVGGDLWVLSGGLEKLALYVADGEIDLEAVELLVAQSQETNVFRVIDAILAGEASRALQLAGQLHQMGAETSYLMAMIGRQLRLVILAQELDAQRVPEGDLGARLGISADFAVRRTREQARRYGRERLVEMYRCLLDADLAIKRGDLRGELAMETLVAELSQRPSGRPKALTRSSSR